MKTAVFILSALLPVAALAAEGDPRVDSEQLRNAIPATMLMDEDVVDENGREVGEVEDVLISRDGELRLYLVEADDYDEDDLDVVPREESEAIAGEPDTQSDFTAKGAADVDRGDVEWGEDLVPVDPADIRYDKEEERAVLRNGARKKAMREDERERMLSLDELVGMEVNLADEDSFGEVEDVMLDDEGRQVVALVIDNWEGLDKQRRALPLSGAIVMTEEEEVVFPYTREQLQGLGEFDLDKYGDGWEMD